MRILHFVPDIGVANGVMSVVLNYLDVYKRQAQGSSGCSHDFAQRDNERCVLHGIRHGRKNLCQLYGCLLYTSHAAAQLENRQQRYEKDYQFVRDLVLKKVNMTEATKV